jgi:hypothetical protein
MLIASTLEGALKFSFSAPIGLLWSTCINQCLTDINLFINSSVLTTTVAGEVTDPDGKKTPGSGSGIGIIVTNPGVVATAKTVLTTTFLNPSTVWATVGGDVANQIDLIIKSATATTVVTGGLTGAGVGAVGCVDTSPGLAIFTAKLLAVFATPGLGWNSITTESSVTKELSIAVYDLLTSCIVTTQDTGVVPPVIWVGTGTGALT